MMDKEKVEKSLSVSDKVQCLVRKPVPGDVEILWQKGNAMTTLRDVCAGLPMGYKKAKKAAIESENYKKRFWDAIYEIYPECKGKVVTYKPLYQTVEWEVPSE